MIRRSGFTLIELITVLAVMGVVGAVVIVHVGRKPSFVMLDDAVNRVQGVLLEGSTQALVQGRKVTVSFNPDSRSFSVSSAAGAAEGGFDHDSMLGRQISKFASYEVPEDIEISFGREDELTAKEYYFYPDGSASGPAFTMSYKGHEFYVDVSPLSGMINATYTEPEK